MHLKASISKAFLVSGSVLVAGMIIVTLGAIIVGGFEGKDLFAAPLLGFCISLGGFILVFPMALVFFLVRSRNSGGAGDEL